MAKPTAAKPKAKAAAPFDERASRQGPLGPIERKTEADLIAEAAKASK